MQKILMSIVMVLGISCNSFKPVIVKHLSITRNSCFVYCVDPNTLKELPDISCGEVFKSGAKPIEICDMVIGIDIGVYAKYMRGKIKQNIQYCKDLQTPY